MKLKKTNLLILLLTTILLLPGCGNKFSKESAQKYIETFMANLSSGNCGELSDDINIFNQIKLFDDKNNEYSNKLISYVYTEYSYTINSVTIENSTKTAKVTIGIRAKDIGSIITNEDFITQLDKELDNFSKSCSTLTEYKETITKYIADAVMAESTCYASRNIQLKLEYDESSQQWNIVNQSDLADILLGNLNKYYISNIYDEITSDIILPKDEIIENTENIESTENTEETTTTEISESTKKDTEIVSIESTTQKTTQEQIIKDNKYYIPDDTEADLLPSSNKTTRSSRRKPIIIGETAIFDNLDYVNPHQKYKIEITLNDVKIGTAAETILNDIAVGKFSKKDTEDYILCKITIKLVENKSDKDTILFSFRDFDLYNYNNEVYSPILINEDNSFEEIKTGETTTGYIAFKYKKNDNINLAFKEYMENTLWFYVK